MNKENLDNYLKTEIGAWVARNTQVIAFDEQTLEVVPTEIDAYGDRIYCFVERTKDTYVVSDDGYLLFKLDPGASKDFYRTAEEIAVGSGFSFNDKNGVISLQTSKEGLAATILKLAQLQVAISYL